MAILPQIRYKKKKGETFLPAGRSGQILAYKTPKIDTDNKIMRARKRRNSAEVELAVA